MNTTGSVRNYSPKRKWGRAEAQPRTLPKRLEVDAKANVEESRRVVLSTGLAERRRVADVWRRVGKFHVIEHVDGLQAEPDADSLGDFDGFVERRVYVPARESDDRRATHAAVAEKRHAEGILDRLRVAPVHVDRPIRHGMPAEVCVGRTDGGYPGSALGQVAVPQFGA